MIVQVTDQKDRIERWCPKTLRNSRSIYRCHERARPWATRSTSCQGPTGEFFLIAIRYETRELRRARKAEEIIESLRSWLVVFYPCNKLMICRATSTPKSWVLRFFSLGAISLRFEMRFLRKEFMCIRHQEKSEVRRGCANWILIFQQQTVFVWKIGTF